MNILVTGSKGQVGSELKRLYANSGHTIYWYDAEELDITREDAVLSFFDNHQIHACINAAAYTAVDKAEQEQNLAYAVNATGAANLAKACQKCKATLVHISTDFVFNGDASTAYSTTAEPSPISVYGASKAAGEKAVLELCDISYVVRTSWVYSSFGGNFVKTMRRLGRERSSLGVVNDQIGAPTWARDLAEALWQFVCHSKDIPYGIYHYTNRGSISWYNFAIRIMELSKLHCQVNPITSAEYPTPARRPFYSVLDLSKSESIEHLTVYDWETSLEKCIVELNEKDMLEKVRVEDIIEIAHLAGSEIMGIYETDDFAVVDKSDNSPLTKADRAANEVIVQRLAELYPEIPIISEENKAIAYADRKNWKVFWLVDPLDGTKEFIKKNGEFTVNIALVKDGKPVLGVVGVPARNHCYYAVEGKGAFKIDEHGNAQPLRVKEADNNKISLIGSRSHPSPEFDAYLKEMETKFEQVDFVPAGSSLKFCLVAEGKADVYPRLGPTMEWDTGAGHAVVLEAGARVKVYGGETDLVYNKENLLNPYFIVEKAS